MELDDLAERGPGTMAIAYACGGCGARVAMVTNPGETQLVRSLGVQIGHEGLVAASPMSTVQDHLAGGRGLAAAVEEPRWTEAAERRLAAAPTFVQGMVRRLYNDWARENGVDEVTPQVMNQAREQLGLSGM
jgi:hypothetical protein